MRTRWLEIFYPKDMEDDVAFDHSKIVHLDDSADDLHQASVYDAYIVSKSRSGLHVLCFHCSLYVSLTFSTLWLYEYRINIYVITRFPYSNSVLYCTTYLKEICTRHKKHMWLPFLRPQTRTTPGNRFENLSRSHVSKYLYPGLALYYPYYMHASQ